MRIRHILTVMLLLVLTACGADDSTDSYSSTGGTSGAGTAPTSLIGYKVVQTVTDSGVISGSPNVIQPGNTITYTFEDANTIYGEGMHNLNVSSWSWSGGSGSGTVRLNYNGIGRSVDNYTFTSDTRGTYYSEMTLDSGSSGWHEGTFVISYVGSSSGGSSTGGSSTGGSSTGGSSTSPTQLMVWTSNSGIDSISVKVDGSSVGSLTYYFNGSGSPDCGDYGVITKTVTPGSHTVYGEASDGSYWGPGTINVAEGICNKFELQ